MNAFDGPDAVTVALVNGEGQYSLWPAHLDVPPGWTVEFGPATSAACLDHVERHWTDLRPRSLRRALEND